MAQKKKINGVAIPELGITGDEDNYRAAVVAAYKRKYPEHARKIISITKRNGRINLIHIVPVAPSTPSHRRGRFLLAQYPRDIRVRHFFYCPSGDITAMTVYRLITSDQLFAAQKLIADHADQRYARFISASEAEAHCRANRKMWRIGRVNVGATEITDGSLLLD